MQCFERKAMYLKLYADTSAEYPELEYDPDLYEDIFSAFSINDFRALIELDQALKPEISKQLLHRGDCEHSTPYPRAVSFR